MLLDNMMLFNIAPFVFSTVDGLDFISPSSINITFWTGSAMGSTNFTLINILQDDILENNEFIYLSLNSSLSYASVSATSGNQTFTIIEDSDSMCIDYCVLAH